MSCRTPRNVGTLVIGRTWFMARAALVSLAKDLGWLSRLAHPEHRESARSPLFRLTSAMEGASL